MLTPYFISSSEWSREDAAVRDRILAGVHRLGAGLVPVFQRELAHTLEVVNSYYSNRMEGNPTRIGDIFNAREGQLAAQPAERNFQLEHLAHIQTAEKMHELATHHSPVSPDFLKSLHRFFYQALPDSMRVATTLSGQTVPIVPGEWRDRPVTVGRFEAPTPEQIQGLMEEFEKAYEPVHLDPRDTLTALAASHHRFLWIHPFADGNGRVVRLFTEALAVRLGYSGQGLYSIARGLARRRQEYDQALAGADAPRWNDLDGRGNLSLRGLSDFCRFFLDVMRDQIEFMGTLLDPRQLETRFHHQLAAWRASHVLSKAEAAVLNYLFKVGQMKRGDIQRAADVERRQASKIAMHLLQQRLVQSDSPKGPIRLHVNKDLARALFPEFFE